MMPTRKEIRNFRRFVSVEQTDLSSPIFFIADAQISNEKMNGSFNKIRKKRRKVLKPKKKDTKHYPDFKSIQL